MSGFNLNLTFSANGKKLPVLPEQRGKSPTQTLASPAVGKTGEEQP